MKILLGHPSSLNIKKMFIWAKLSLCQSIEPQQEEHRTGKHGIRVYFDHLLFILDEATTSLCLRLGLLTLCLPTQRYVLENSLRSQTHCSISDHGHCYPAYLSVAGNGQSWRAGVDRAKANSPTPLSCLDSNFERSLDESTLAPDNVSGRPP